MLEAQIMTLQWIKSIDFNFIITMEPLSLKPFFKWFETKSWICSFKGMRIIFPKSKFSKWFLNLKILFL